MSFLAVCAKYSLREYYMVSNSPSPSGRPDLYKLMQWETKRKQNDKPSDIQFSVHFLSFYSRFSKQSVCTFLLYKQRLINVFSFFGFSLVFMWINDYCFYSSLDDIYEHNCFIRTNVFQPFYPTILNIWKIFQEINYIPKVQILCWNS